MKKYKLLLVGLGPRGLNWFDTIRKNKMANIIGICDLNKKNSFKKKINLPFYTNLEKSIIELKPEMVLLATPPFDRMQDIKICAKYRLPVLAEKPLATNFAEAKNIVKFMMKKKLLLMIGLNFRYLPVTKETKKLIYNNKLGKPSYAKFIYERWRDGRLSRLNKYPLSMKQPMLWEQSIHHFDLIRYVYNSNVKKVFAKTINPSWSMYKYETNVNAILELYNGIIVNYIGTWQSSSKIFNFEWRTECEKGIILQKNQFSDLYFNRTNSSKLHNIPLKNFKMWKDDSKLLLLDFLKSIKIKKNYKNFGYDHLNSLAIVDACIESSKQGKSVELKQY